jgi:diguanylate cyclase (GGDEF)-like protein
MEHEGVIRQTWLCRTRTDRERLVDMEERIKPLRAVSIGLLAIALLACGPWVGWWTLIPLSAAALGFTLCDRSLRTAQRPELRMAAAWLLSELAIACSVALTGGPRSPAVAWLVIPVTTLAARFNTRGVIAGASLVAALILGSTFGVAPSYVLHHPQNVVFPLALLGGISLLSLALMRSDLQHRSASVIDPLTSMLNRNALATRVEELRHQAAHVHQPIGLILGDLDCFKQINDRYGHATGDNVLRDVGYCLRKQLRAFDLVYRLGGEEFLILLPGADAKRSAAVAEGLREAVAAAMQKPQVTISFGVTASQPGRFDYASSLEAADRALYLAKAAGRNQVMSAVSEWDPADAVLAVAS